MTDKEYKKQKARVEKLLDKWLGPVGLAWWTIDVVFSRQLAENASRLGECNAAWQYREAMITFYLPAMAKLSDKRAEECVVHELVHVFLNEMRDYSKDYNHEEHVATALTRAFIYLKEKT